jgi:hypothetical protein
MSSGASKVIVLDPDPRAGRQVQLGFEREGVPTFVPSIPADAATLDLDGAEPGIVLVGGRDGQALELVRRAKAWLTARRADVPIVSTGRGPSRRDLEAAGADEVISRPLYLRDVVTLARMLRGVPRAERDHLVGSLVETSNVLALVRAFSALGRSATLTLIRGLRRGEVRFFHGEVTSAQVGLIHGQAALHQLLLWTDARFDFAHEDIVRRQQIPLSPEELFADAESFLEGVREHAGNLSPASVLEQDTQRVHALGKQIPTEVHGVLRMFDGHRVLADVLEDSPYRVFETLRVAQKAVEVGLLKLVESQRPKATWRAVLAIEEWLVGNETRDAVVERTANIDSGPVTSKKRRGKKRRSKQKVQVTAPLPETKDIDWGALVPRVIGAEVGPLSGVVPAQETHGEVELPTRSAPREGLESMDTDKRQRIFPTDIGLEPKVVIGDDAGEVKRAATVEKQKADVVAMAETPPVGMPATTEAEAAKTLAADKPRPSVNAGHARSKPGALPPLPPGAEEIDPGTAALVAVPQYLGNSTSDPVAAVTSMPATTSEPRSARAGTTDAKDLVRALVAEAVPTPSNGSGPTPQMIAEMRSDAVTAKTRPVEDAVTTPFAKPSGDGATANALIAEPITVAERGRTRLAVADVLSVKSTGDTAVVTAKPSMLISEQPTVAPVASLEPARAVSAPPPKAPDDAAPHATEDEPSDGVVRGMIATADTPRARMRPPEPAPAHDGPEIKERTGEIRERPRTDKDKEPEVSQPSILVADLAAAHDAVAAAATKAAAAPPPADAATSSREREVADVRRDAVAFSDSEEAFFRGADKSKPVERVSHETFADLDEGYEPPKFWDRVFGRKPKK